ncbi:hypothetical protein QQX98_000544 [Neonectria punicea]|uniref:Clr5 domain-containing protein n=1 Tax=Neonectria punicea TaxID=979145 RepID=A0ABR1HUJ4_9HYPO
MASLNVDVSRPSRSNVRETPANPVPDEEWNNHKQAVRDLYIDKNLRLQDVMEIMEKEHGFRATKAQYNTQLRRWGLSKNNKRDHQAPTGDGGPRDKRHCSRAEPQPVEDSYSSLELTAPAPDANLPDFTVTDDAARPADVEPHTFPSIFDDGQSANPGSIGQGTFARPSGNMYPGSQPRMHMGYQQPLSNEFPSYLGSQYVMNQHVNPQQDVQGSSFNLSYEPWASNTMNIIAEGDTQTSEHARPTLGRAFSSQVPRTLRQPIHQAAQAGNYASVKFLLDVAPACAHVTGGRDITPLWIAAQGGYLRIVDLLLRYDVDVQIPLVDTRRTPIHQAAQEGHFEVVQRLLEHRAHPDPRDENGVSPLWSAAQQGHFKIVKLLLDKKASTETTSKNGERRPIHQAAQNGHVEVVRALLEAGAEANPERQSFNDETPSPFWLAAQNGNVSIGKLLIDRGANHEFAIGSSKRRPIHQATQNGHTDFVRLLIGRGVNVDSREEDGWTPLIMAAQEGHLEIVKNLLDSSANVNAEEKDRATALWVASQQGHIDVVKKLREAGAKIISTKHSRRRPIHQATQNGHLEVVKFLVNECEEDVNAEADQEATPLVLASQGEDENRVEIMKFLYEKGAKTVI